MNQLSLIPVNASLFAALLTDDIITNGKDGLKEQAKVKKENYLTKACWIANRELTSTERVTMTIDFVDVEYHFLGLTHKFHTKDSVGIVKNVWAFVYLTMQEFTSVIFLKSTS